MCVIKITQMDSLSMIYMGIAVTLVGHNLKFYLQEVLLIGDHTFIIQGYPTLSSSSSSPIVKLNLH
jgi:hypothetical protein